MNYKVWAVVPAGGVGARMCSDIPKQYMGLIGKSVLIHALERVCSVPSVFGAVVGISDQDQQWTSQKVATKKQIFTAKAGAERVDTVQNCLTKILEVGSDQDWALVHDAARPCVKVDEISELIARVLANTRSDAQAADGGILAVPLSDTIKRASVNADIINETVPREALWRAMTPQLFKVGDLLQAIEHAKHEGVHITDDSSAMEAYGCKPLLVPCSPDNIKITLAEDINFAEMILNSQNKSHDN